MVYSDLAKQRKLPSVPLPVARASPPTATRLLAWMAFIPTPARGADAGQCAEGVARDGKNQERPNESPPGRPSCPTLLHYPRTVTVARLAVSHVLKHTRSSREGTPLAPHRGHPRAGESRTSSTAYGGPNRQRRSVQIMVTGCYADQLRLGLSAALKRLFMTRSAQSRSLSCTVC